MRRLLSLLLTIGVMMLVCGCGQNTGVAPTLNGIEFEADVHYNGAKYKSSVTIDKTGKFTAYITSPAELSGMTVTVGNDGAYVDYMGITQKIGESLPKGNAVFILYKIIDGIPKESVLLKDRNCVINGKYGSAEYEFHISPSGLPLSLNIPDLNFNAVFNNVTVV